MGNKNKPCQEFLDQLQFEARRLSNFNDGETHLISNLKEWPEIMKDELLRYRNASWFIMDNKRYK